MKTSEKITITIFIFMAIFASFFFYSNWQINNFFQKEKQSEDAQKTQIENKIDALHLEAKAISVYDMNLGKELYGKNEHMPMALASITKTMTVLIALETRPSGDKIKISRFAINQAEDSGLILNEVWKLEDLAKFTLIMSSNDGAWALSEGIDNFIGLMNQKAAHLGMTDTIFYNPTGLDLDATHAGAYSSAYDVNIMTSFAINVRPDIFNATTEKSDQFTSSVKVHNAKNTDILTKEKNNFLFSKTGFTDLAGGNLTVIFQNKDGHDIAITVLGSTLKGRFSDMEKLVNVL